MSIPGHDAVRENVYVVVGLAGASGAGKTMSAFRLAQGMVGRETRFGVIDTETRRALHYAPAPGASPNFKDTFRFGHEELKAPFRPDAYLAAIMKMADLGYQAIVVDSFSHVHEGEGGLLDWQEEILTARVERAMASRKGATEWDLRQAYNRLAWVEPKMSHKRMVQRLLQVRAHIILCLRAEDKLDQVKDKDGKTIFVPMETLAGFKGWIPICEKRLPFELTMSFVLTPDQPGFPKPIKLQEQHRPFFPLDRAITEQSGIHLAAWARGGAGTPSLASTLGVTDSHRAAAEGKPGAKAPETGAGELFPPRGESRAALLGTIQGLADNLKLTKETRKALWAEHVGAGVPDADASVEQLGRLCEAVRGWKKI